MNPLEELSQIVQEANSAYSHIPYDISYFRSVEQKLEDCFIKLPPEELNTELFTVYLTLEHLLTVLTGDVRYHSQSVQLVQEIFSSAGTLLVALIKLVKEGGSAKKQFDTSYSETVRTYLGKVQQINELLKTEA